MQYNQCLVRCYLWLTCMVDVVRRLKAEWNPFLERPAAALEAGAEIRV